MAKPNAGVTDMRPPEHRKIAPGLKPGAPTTPINQPYIDPGAQPQVAAYIEAAAARAAARQGGGLPKYSTPVGGGRGPAIPRLDGAHVEGQTMAAQAEHVNSPPLHQQMQQVQGSIVESPALGMPLSRPQSPAEAARGLGLQNTDMLPPEAQADPEFQRGHGDMFAVSQPHLALRYGVMRNGQRLMPQQLRTQGQGAAPRGLRPETLQGLQDLQELQKQQALSPDQRKAMEEAADEDVKQSSAGASSTAGTPVMSEEEAQRRIEALDAFDFNALREAINRDLLNNPDQRKLIEARLEPLDITDLIIKNRVSQRVPIVPRKFEVTYRSMTGNDDLALKRLLMHESRSVEVTERYLLDKYAFMALTCGVVAVNNNTLPDHLDDNGDFDEKKFWTKFEWVMKRPLHMLSSIGVNHTWFESRVRKLFVAENVGNG